MMSRIFCALMRYQGTNSLLTVIDSSCCYYNQRLHVQASYIFGEALEIKFIFPTKVRNYPAQRI